jgi:hypothetical protein
METAKETTMAGRLHRSVISRKSAAVEKGLFFRRVMRPRTALRWGKRPNRRIISA